MLERIRECVKIQPEHAHVVYLGVDDQFLGAKPERTRWRASGMPLRLMEDDDR